MKSLSCTAINHWFSSGVPSRSQQLALCFLKLLIHVSFSRPEDLYCSGEQKTGVAVLYPATNFFPLVLFLFCSVLWLSNQACSVAQCTRQSKCLIWFCKEERPLFCIVFELGQLQCSETSKQGKSFVVVFFKKRSSVAWHHSVPLTYGSASSTLL